MGMEPILPRPLGHNDASCCGAGDKFLQISVTVESLFYFTLMAMAMMGVGILWL